MKKLYSLVGKHLYLLLLIILPILFFQKVIFDPNSMLYPYHDIVSIFSQEKKLFQDTFQAFNTLPLWNPYIFGGSPFVGNPTPAMFYPTNLLFLFLPIDWVFGIIFTIDIILLGLFTFFYAKSINLNKFGAFISAIIIMFCGPIITLTFPGHLINLDTFIWLPLILLIYENAIKKQKIIYGLYSAFPIALTLLAGASQIAAFSLLSASIYFILRSILSLPKANKPLYLKKIILIFLVSISIGILLSAIQIIPTIEFSRLSARSDGLSYDFASDFSLPPKQIISFILPYFFGNPADGTYWGKGNFWSLNGYVGIFPFLLAIIAFAAKPRRLAAVFIILGLFALLFSFGKYSFISPFFYKYVPQFDSFRAPARFLYVYSFSLAILSGIGINVLMQNVRGIKKFLMKLSSLLFLLAISSLIISVIFILNKNIQLYEKYILNYSYAVGVNHLNLRAHLINDLTILSIALFTISLIFFLKYKNKISINIFKTLLAIIILLDLWYFSSKFISVKKISDAYPANNLVNIIKNDKETFRIFDKENLYLPISERNNIENITGIHSLYLRDYRDFIWSIGTHENKPYESFFQIKKIEYPIFLDLLNVKYVIENDRLTKNPDFLPRAFIVPNAIVLKKQEILENLKNNNFDPKMQVLLQEDPGVKINNPSSFKKVGVYYRDPNNIKLRANLDESGFLVLSEINYPGWKAYDNGKEMKILNANYVLRSIYLNKGPHDISFVYDPYSFKLGKDISISTLIFCALFLCLGRKSRLVDEKKLFL